VYSVSSLDELKRALSEFRGILERSAKRAREAPLKEGADTFFKIVARELRMRRLARGETVLQLVAASKAGFVYPYSEEEREFYAFYDPDEHAVYVSPRVQTIALFSTSLCTHSTSCTRESTGSCCPRFS
jgi:hypothetical protein